MLQTKPSIGKIRGFTCTANQADVFSILAFDHRQSSIKMLNPGQVDEQDYPAIVAAKTQFVRLLALHASAVLLDPVYGAAQSVAGGALRGTSGLIVALEETGYTGSDTARESAILPGWRVQKTKRMGADAIKLLVYYHPDAGSITARQVEIACTAGASGSIAGRAVWQEAVSRLEGQRERWLTDVGALRLEGLYRIDSCYARPWRDFFPNLAASGSEHWYLHYDS